MNNRQLRNALKGLGDSPSTVRDTLLAEHALGYQEDGTSCPLANYLHEKFPEAIFTVGPISILYWTEGSPLDILDAMVDCPEAVSLFVRRFDNGHYPELVLHKEA